MHNCPSAMTRVIWTEGQHGRRASRSYRYRGQDLSSHERHAIVTALKSTGGNIRLTDYCVGGVPPETLVLGLARIAHACLGV